MVLTTKDVLQIDQGFFHFESFFAKLKMSDLWEVFAIRSSALTEDGEIASQAGRYMSILDVHIDDVESAIREIILDYKKKEWSSDANGLSIIIQKFIQADISGVTFTRNPAHDRNMYVEYVSARWDTLVGGEHIPQVWQAYRNWKTHFPLENGENYIKTWWDIEDLFDAAMDIEWCISHGELFILQARPITTITQEEFLSYRFLDKELEWKEEFLYMTDMATEMTPTPTPFTYSLLRKISDDAGPISRYYQKNRINYHDPEHFHLFGNTLYIDKKREKKQFNGKNLMELMKNKMWLLFLRPEKLEHLGNEIQIIKSRKLEWLLFNELMTQFLADYTTIYSINFAAGFYQKVAEKIRSIPSIKSPEIDGTWLMWNSLEIADESEWRTFSSEGNQNENTGIYGDLHTKISTYLSFREVWRSIVVRYISAIRRELMKVAKAHGITEYRDLYFLTVDELLEDRIDPIVIRLRMAKYEKNKIYSFPQIISSELPEHNRKHEPLWVSWEYMEWTLASIDTLNTSTRPIILYTRYLSPDIVAYFDRIDGIISENGGALSHLALVGRERGIPIIIDEKVLEKHHIGDILTRKK